MIDGWDVFLFFFAVKSCTFNSMCFSINLCDTAWLMSGWLRNSWLGQPRPSYSNLMLLRAFWTRFIWAQDVKKRQWELQLRNLSVLYIRHRIPHVRWAKTCSQAFVSNLTENYVYFFLHYFFNYWGETVIMLGQSEIPVMMFSIPPLFHVSL